MVKKLIKLFFALVIVFITSCNPKTPYTEFYVSYHVGVKSENGFVVNYLLEREDIDLSTFEAYSEFDPTEKITEFTEGDIVTFYYYDKEMKNFKIALVNKVEIAELYFYEYAHSSDYTYHVTKDEYKKYIFNVPRWIVIYHIDKRTILNLSSEPLFIYAVFQEENVGEDMIVNPIAYYYYSPFFLTY